MPSSKGTLADYVEKIDTTKAEIIWAMKCVDSHYSMHSCGEIRDVFASMFTDSAIARSFQSAENKTTYLCTHRLGPYFKQQLKDQPGYFLLFDETLNSNIQEKQMDIYVRIWEEECVKTLFYGSKFLGHATADDIVSVLSPIITKLGHSRLLQISMDSPNVNKKVHRLLQTEVEKSTGTKKILQTGTCGLHTIHNAFRSGCEAAKWDLEAFLTSIYHLFHDSPARRDDFTNIVDAPALPFKFCKQRWLEYVEPAERAILLLPHLVSYCSHAKNQSTAEPSCKSYKDLLEMLGDTLLKARLQFFATISEELQPFLRDYQTDRPMMPFLVPQIARLLKSFMERFLKPSVTSRVNAICLIDFEEKSNRVETNKVDVGFSANQTLLAKDGPSDRAKHSFRSDCRAFLLTMIRKILNKSPMSYQLPKNLEWMDPQCLTKTFKDADEQGQWNTSLRSQLDKTMAILCDSGRLDTNTADKVRQQFKELQTDVKSDPDFLNFDPHDTEKGIDTLFFRKLCKNKKFVDLWGIMQNLLLLSHGQATVERGFSQNKQATTDNLQKEGLVARRRIIQAVRKAGGAAKVPLTKQLLGYASVARVY